MALRSTLPSEIPIEIADQISDSPVFAPLKIDSEDCLTSELLRHAT